MRAAGGSVSLEVLAVGPEREDEALGFALACGADRALRVWHPALEHADYYAVGRVLAAAVRLRGFTWVLCGDRSADEGLGATGPAVAEFLGVPHLSGAREVRGEGDGGTVLALRRGEGLVQELRVRGPAVLCIADGPAPVPAAAKPKPRTRPAARAARPRLAGGAGRGAPSPAPLPRRGRGPPRPAAEIC